MESKRVGIGMDRLIVDGHCHAWLNWPYDRVPDPQSRGSVDQLLYAMDQNNVSEALVVSACIDRTRDNNEYVAEWVQRYPQRLHHIADVDSKWSLTYHLSGAAERLVVAAGKYKIRGATHYLRSQNDGWLRSDDGKEFFHAASDLGLVISLALSPAWYEDLCAIARDFPTVPILCHHMAGILRAPDVPAALEGFLRAASDVDNVLVKVSGLNYGSPSPWNYPHTTILPLVQRLHGALGARRLCWGSDAPVSASRVGISYRQTLEILRTHCPFLTEDDLAWILGGTLRRMLLKTAAARRAKN